MILSNTIIDLTGYTVLKMKTILRLVPVLLLCFVLTAVGICGEDGDETMRVTKTYQYTKENAVVSVKDTVIRDLNEVTEISPVDFIFEGEGVTFVIPYENIYRETAKYINYDEEGNVVGYRDFTAAVTVTDVADTAALPASLHVCDGCFLDFADGESYPGLTRLSAELGKEYGGKTVSIYTVTGEGDGISLCPAVKGLFLSVDGVLSLDVTESHDYLVLVGDTAAADKYVYPVVMRDDPGLGTVPIILIAVGAVVLCAIVAWIAVRFTSPKRMIERAKQTDAKEKKGRKEQK